MIVEGTHTTRTVQIYQLLLYVSAQYVLDRKKHGDGGSLYSLPYHSRNVLLLSTISILLLLCNFLGAHPVVCRFISFR